MTAEQPTPPSFAVYEHKPCPLPDDRSREAMGVKGRTRCDNSGFVIYACDGCRGDGTRVDLTSAIPVERMSGLDHALHEPCDEDVFVPDHQEEQP